MENEQGNPSQPVEKKDDSFVSCCGCVIMLVCIGVLFSYLVEYLKNIDEKDIEKFTRVVYAAYKEYNKPDDGGYNKYVNRIDVENTKVNKKARLIVKESGNDSLIKAKLLYEFVRDEIRYVSDPNIDKDYVTSPVHTMESQSGDCEDQAILLCSLLGSVGLQCYLVFIEHHTFVMVEIKGNPAIIDRQIKTSYRLLNSPDVHVVLDPTTSDKFSYTYYDVSSILAIYDAKTKKRVE